MWKIKQIAEADFGCEERMPGEKLKCLVILEDESGNVRCLETVRRKSAVSADAMGVIRYL